jgi:hypothetical protein
MAKGKPKGSATATEGVTAMLVSAVSGPAGATVTASNGGVEAQLPLATAAVTGVDEPFDLQQLQAVKEWIRQEHPKWYPDYRDTFGHSLTAKVAPQLAGLDAAELGLPPTADADRVQRERRALAFAKTYLMASAGDVKGLQTASQDLAYWWNDHLDGKLIPPEPVDPSNPAPWVATINTLRSRQVGSMDAKYKVSQRYRQFVQAVKEWTDGRWRALRKAVKQVLSGGHGGHDHGKANELIQAIRSAPSSAPRLWRKESASSVAERLGVPAQQLVEALKPRIGHELTQDVVSASDKSSVWSGNFIWEIEPGAQAVHAYPISYHPSEHEWITAGRFRVLEVSQPSTGTVKVRVEQTGVF